MARKSNLNFWNETLNENQEQENTDQIQALEKAKQYRRNVINAEISKLNTEIEELKEKLEQYEKMEGQMNQAKGQMEIAKSELLSSKTLLKNTYCNSEKAAKIGSKMQEENEEINGTIKKLNSMIASAEQKITELKASITIKQNKIKNLKITLNSL